MQPIIRNIGIFAHIDAGKTTFTERILFESGELSSPGSVEDGTTEMDTLPEEVARGISIIASTTQIQYKIKQKLYLINLIDTPGHLDFHSQVDAALLAVDMAVLLIDVTSGIRSQTELISKKLLEKKIPILLFLNKLDRSLELSDLIKEIQTLFPMQTLPVFQITPSRTLQYRPLEKDIQEDIELAFVEWSSEWTETYFVSKDPKKTLLSGLREGFKLCKHIPIFAGSGLTGLGVKECLQFLCSVEPPRDPRPYDAILFKKQIHPHLGRISYLKTFVPLREGEVLFHRDVPHRVPKLFSLIPGGFHEVREIDAFSIGAFQSPEGGETDHWQVGELLWKEPPAEGEERETGSFPNFGKEFIQILEPETEEDRNLLEASLRGVVWEDPGLEFSIQRDTGQFQLSGMGELHLDVSIKRLESFLQDRFTKKNLFVSTYGFLNSSATGLTWEHHTSDFKFFSHSLFVEISQSGTFENTIRFSCKVSPSLQKAIESAFFEILSHAADGLPILGVRLELKKLEPPVVESEHSTPLTKVAVIAGLKTYLVNRWKKISPLTTFEILVPHSQVGLVISMLQKRNARVSGMVALDTQKTRVHGTAASASLLGFTATMRNLTQGRATISLLTDFSIQSYSEV